MFDLVASNQYGPIAIIKNVPQMWSLDEVKVWYKERFGDDVTIRAVQTVPFNEPQCAAANK